MPYKLKERQTEHYEKNKTEYYFRNIKNKFGLSSEDYFEMLCEQGFKCKLCEEELKPINKLTHVDHCHETNKVRGILCMPCNVALGMLGDNEKGLMRALEYVRGELK